MFTGQDVRKGEELRVVYLVRRYPVMSQTFVSNEVAELRRQGVRVTVVSLWRSDDYGADDDDGLVLGSVRIPRASQWQALLALVVRHPRRAVRFARLRWDLGDEPIAWSRLPWLAARLEGERVATFHAHFAWEGATVAWALGLLTGRPWSVTVHANDLFSEPSHLEKKLAAADALVTVCDYNIEWLRSEATYSKEIHKVVCGVELPPAKHKPRAAGPDVLAVGRLVEKKGFDVLIAAVADLRSRGLEVSCEIVGEGPERSRLEQMASALGASVRLAGEQPNDAVLDRMWQARVICVPSRIATDGDRDSMPVVAKEAMARSVPVVGTIVGGIPEMVDESCGILVPPDDASALADALAEILADEEGRLRLGANARQRVADRFTLSGEVRKLRELFEELDGFE